MAKKLKYPYEQWKNEQEKIGPSRSPSPIDPSAISEPEDDHLERSNQLSNAAAQLAAEAGAASVSESGPLSNHHSKLLFACFWVDFLYIIARFMDILLVLLQKSLFPVVFECVNIFMACFITQTVDKIFLKDISRYLNFLTLSVKAYQTFEVS